MKRLSCVLLSCFLVMMSCIPVLANDDIILVGADSNSESTQVEYVSTSNFTVTIPKLIVLSGIADTDGNYKGNYDISVSGDIGSDVSISVVPRSPFDLKQSGRDNISASVTQGAQIFKLGTGSVSINDSTHECVIPFDRFKTGYTAPNTGEVSARDLSAGTWTGNFRFDISCDRLIDYYVVSWDAPLATALQHSQEPALPDAGFVTDSMLNVAENYHSMGVINDYDIHLVTQVGSGDTAPVDVDHGGWKRIIYTDETGVIRSVDPFSVDTIHAKKNTMIYFQMYAPNVDPGNATYEMEGSGRIYIGDGLLSLTGNNDCDYRSDGWYDSLDEIDACSMYSAYGKLISVGIQPDRDLKLSATSRGWGEFSGYPNSTTMMWNIDADE